MKIVFQFTKKEIEFLNKIKDEFDSTFIDKETQKEFKKEIHSLVEGGLIKKKPHDEFKITNKSLEIINHVSSFNTFIGEYFFIAIGEDAEKINNANIHCNVVDRNELKELLK